MEEQSMEIEALLSIYGEDVRWQPSNHMVEIHVPSRDHPRKLVLRAFLPADYPSSASPAVEVLSPHLSHENRALIGDGFEDFRIPGSPCLFNMAEWLREREFLWAAEDGGGGDDETTDLKMGARVESDRWVEKEEEEEEEGNEGNEGGIYIQGGKFRRELRSEATTDSMWSHAVAKVEANIVTGEPLTERKSTFQAHVCPVNDEMEVEAMIEILFRHNKIRNATHNILAYRIHQAENNTWLQDSDDGVGPDDAGEDAAGGRLLHMLQISGVENCAVVVTRWFGGVLLGPSRFALINNTARNLLEQTGYIVKKKSNAKKK